MTYLAIAKKVAHTVVALNVSAVASTQIENHTQFDSDSITNQVGSMVIGQVVANQTDRITDPAVERIFAGYVKFRNRKNTEKQES